MGGRKDEVVAIIFILSFRTETGVVVSTEQGGSLDSRFPHIPVTQPRAETGHGEDSGWH